MLINHPNNTTMEYIAYYRVSTKHQGQSGLGLEAQRTSVLNYIKARGVDQEPPSYTEVESGKDNNREQLRQAIAHAKRDGATLLVAKLDRLSRDVAFIFSLKSELEKAHVDFVVCDMPELNTLTLGIMASVAQHERELISSRTKAGLDEARKRGTTFGTPENLTEEARQKAHRAISAKAINSQANRFAYHFIKPLREQGESYQAISEKLNREGYQTSYGYAFHPAQVRRIYIRHNNKG
jgi:DNA invertase Pin-like site-specific DNA recombinase